VPGGSTIGVTASPQRPVAGLPIVDAHQHFWDPERHYYPWLNDEPPIPFRYGDYRAIRRRYLPADYLRDAAPYRIAKTVYVEAEWDPRDPMGEMRFVGELRGKYGLPTVAVAQAWLDHDDAATVLARQAELPFVRGVRHKPRANRAPNDAAPGGTADPRWRAGYRELARHGLRFDLQTPWWHLAEAARLAADFPDTTIILNHTGLPADRSAAAIAGWKRAMAAFATCENTAVKISGLGQPARRWTAAANRDIVRTVIDLYGIERCMFASNFPVDSLCASFAEIFAGFEEIVRDLAAHERHALFHDNAIRVYAME
jgi:predicted TIM-barrel fold metal-dependent hydrolase